MGLYDTKDAGVLTTWLEKNLDAISDADPGALAKYIIELLSMWNNDPEKDVRPRLVEELADFLQKESAPFVDRLLSTLRSKSYLPYTTTSGPTPHSRGRKRGLEQDEQEKVQERELRGPPKGPRLHDERRGRKPPDGPRSHSQKPPDRNSEQGQADGTQSDGLSSSSRFRRTPPTGPRADQRPEKCRNYYEIGYCNVGPSCPYYHGEDAVMSNGTPMGFPNGMPGGMPLPFPPNMNPAIALQMLNGLFPPGFHPGMFGPGFGMNGPFNGMPVFPNQPPMNDSGIQDLTPRGQQHRQNGAPSQSEDAMMTDGGQNGNADSATGQQQPMQFPRHERGPSRGGGRGRGTRPERSHRNNVVDPNAVTIVVEKLPPEKVNIPDLTAYFGKFGTVTNVGLDTRGNRALVSFATHQEAHAAWKSEEAIFGNRFVVVFWHRPAPGRGVAGQKALEASASQVQKLNAVANGAEDVQMQDTSTSTASGSTYPKPTGGYPSSSHSGANTQQKATQMSPQEVFEYAQRVWMDKMKAVMDVLQSSTATEAEKMEAKAKFKVLKSQKPQPPPATPAPTAKTEPSSSKDALDLDLDMLASGAGQMTQEEAQQALARLQELAAERGLDPTAVDQEQEGQPSYGYRGASSRGRGWRGGYRVRGRGRGRGAFALANASLDNRTKKLLLQGYDEAGVTDDLALEMAQSFYLPSGQAEDVQKADSGGLVVTFSSRALAELALRGGPPSIEGLGKLTVQWYNPASNDNHNVPVASARELSRDASTDATPEAISRRPIRGDDEDHEWEHDDEDETGRRRR